MLAQPQALGSCRCLSPALSLAHGQDLLLPPSSSSCLLGGCGTVASSEGMAHTRVPRSATPFKAALSLPGGWNWWYPKAQHPQNPMYLNASFTAATRLHVFPLFFLQNQMKILCLPPSLSQYLDCGHLSHHHCQQPTAWSSLLLTCGALQHTQR